jgi:magnesium-transporting ATPase (P-type)
MIFKSLNYFLNIRQIEQFRNNVNHPNTYNPLQVVCSDKTGTLTTGEMTATEVVTADGKVYEVDSLRSASAKYSQKHGKQLEAKLEPIWRGALLNTTVTVDGEALLGQRRSSKSHVGGRSSKSGGLSSERKGTLAEDFLQDGTDSSGEEGNSNSPGNSNVVTAKDCSGSPTEVAVFFAALVKNVLPGSYGVDVAKSEAKKQEFENAGRKQQANSPESSDSESDTESENGDNNCVDLLDLGATTGNANSPRNVKRSASESLFQSNSTSANGVVRPNLTKSGLSSASCKRFRDYFCQYDKVFEIPFNSANKYMLTVHRIPGENGKEI